nr:MAG TPA: hypothetical protein [Bacteriophage sp.]
MFRNLFLANPLLFLGFSLITSSLYRVFPIMSSYF